MVLRVMVIFVLLSSCARQSEWIPAQRSFLSESSLTLQSRLPGAGEGVEPEIRSISLVIFPTREDLQGFEYIPGEEVAFHWDSLGDHLSYGDRLLRSYSTAMNGAEKLEKMVTTVLAMAQLRTDMFRNRVPLQRQAEVMGERIKSENRAVKDELRNISCYYEEEPVDGVYQCRTTQGEDEGLQHKVLSSCRHLEGHRFPEEDEPANWDQIGNRCEVLGEQRASRSEMLNRIEGYDYLRQQGEGVLLDILLAAERHSGAKSFLALGACKERLDSEGRFSTLRFDPTTEDVRELVLFLDLGENYSAGSGFREYSTTNGGIVNLRMEKAGWADVLKFTLVTADFDAHASLSLTVQEFSGVRFVGEITIAYPDGSGSRGLMALELDRLQE